MSKAGREKSAAPSSLEIHLLGPFRAAVDGRAVEPRRWSRRKPALLVKLLALQPHHQLHREQVAEHLWPDLDAEAAANNLHKSIHAARRALEPALKSGADSHFLLARGQQVVLCAPGRLWVDAEEFERAAAEALASSDPRGYEPALALYEGDLLIEDPYEDWAAARREQLRALRQELLARLAGLYEARGEGGQAVGWLKELVARDPTNEDAHRRLMRLHALAGDRHQALRQYRQCCEDLSRELDARPEPDTVKLHEQIVAGGIQPLTADGTDAAAPPRRQAVSSIAVLPLANDGADPSVEYLSDGITEGIIESLSRLPALRVMAWNTVSRYKGREVDPREVGRELGVGAVLTGRVLQLSGHLVVKTELVDAADGSHLWGGQYRRELADAFAVEGEVSRDISEKLRLKLTGAEKERLTRRRTASAAAYQLYLKGRFFWYKRTEEALRKSIEFFNRAIEEDPAYAAAYDGLSDSYALLALRGLIPHQEAFRRAKAAARKALEIDDSLGEAHASLAHIRLHEWDWSGLDEEFRRALELNPGHSIAYHWYSEYLTAMGRSDESIETIAKAKEIDPLSPISWVGLSSRLYLARRYEEAIEQIREGFEINPDHFMLHLDLGLIYVAAGMHGEAVEEMQKAVSLSGGSNETLAGLARAYAAVGRRGDARKVLGELIESSRVRYVSPYSVAKVYASLGDKGRAFRWLEKGYEERHPDFIELKAEPALDPLRPDPRFRDLLRRVRLAP